MSYTAETKADQNWQRSNKFFPFGYLKELCLKALTLALVGRSVPRLSEVPSDSHHRNTQP
jgi:hypothetical protein